MKPFAILLLADLTLRTYEHENAWFDARYEYARDRVAHEPYRYSENHGHYIRL